MKTMSIDISNSRHDHSAPLQRLLPLRHPLQHQPDQALPLPGDFYTRDRNRVHMS